jgi:hypothetical protein
VTSVLHPRHGIHAPTAGTPERAPGSVRRTATILSAENGLLNLLLDDFPVATLVSGHAIGAGLAGRDRTALSLSLSSAEASGRPRAERPGFGRDLCAGFADGGAIVNDVDATGRPPW